MRPGLDLDAAAASAGFAVSGASTLEMRTIGRMMPATMAPARRLLRTEVLPFV